MLPLGLFRRRAFTVANLETLAMYGGIAIFGFFLTIFLQQVAGWSATEAGAVSLIPTGVMFALSRRAGALADRYGPRWFMAGGPFLVSGGFLLMLRFDQSTSFLTDVLPAMLLFSLGLAATVSPLTATVLADADETDAGIASAVNNAVARTAGPPGHGRRRRRHRVGLDGEDRRHRGRTHASGAARPGPRRRARAGAADGRRGARAGSARSRTRSRRPACRASTSPS